MKESFKYHLYLYDESLPVNILVTFNRMRLLADVLEDVLDDVLEDVLDDVDTTEVRDMLAGDYERDDVGGGE